MSNEAKPPYWELHILPMFRLLDQEHMIGDTPPPNVRVNLYDYDQVSQRATVILGALQDDFMPPSNEGGPWPAEWVTLFVRWVQKKCPRLARGQASWTAVRAGNNVTLTAVVNLPRGGDQTWIEPIASQGPAHRFVLYLEPTGAGGPVTVTRVTTFKEGTGIDYVLVEDAEGERKVPITG